MPDLYLLLKIFFLPFVFSGFASLVLTMVVRKIYIQKGWLDDPKQSSHPKVVHTYPVPRGGGVALYLAVFISAIFFLRFDQKVIGILLGGLVLAVVGFYDDRINLSPYIRLWLGFFAASMVVMSGVGIAFVTNPFGEGVLNLNWPQISFSLFGQARSIWVISDIFALVWIVWSMNMVNWSKGLDGQLPGVVVVAAVTIAVLSLLLLHP